ncbi:alpha/beta fold hydrolase [Geodermatophilus sp. YIM 151500]|uniref:PHA/PHB synthase family protein n=1 Tax=Geodermatophilus sp. YIM 151500 TaxID=2984531 RepID=UPI0021E4DEC1|nr:alpha/beta fold hydrolase [Geodermatophilus sp. YIM 151500]MCV2490329.1 alpha/beta fold hydrolase [Geodermatophilus sp. YIM 151500]
MTRSASDRSRTRGTARPSGRGARRGPARGAASAGAADKGSPSPGAAEKDGPPPRAAGAGGTPPSAADPRGGRGADGPESDAVEAATGLDMVLVDVARGPIRRLVPPAGTALRFGAALARRPGTVVRRSGGLAQELARVVAGRSELAPSPKDKRFTDPAWTGNPLLRRAMQAHLATARTAWELMDDADLDWRDDERMRFSLTNLVDALAPSNVPVVNPLMWKAVIDTGGRNAVTGLRRLVSDLASPPRIPAMVDPDAFTVGDDLAVTPGVVVLRTPVFELIRYRPTTETVRAVPLLMVPPTINKYYIADLAPGRSIVEHYVAGGQQVFMMSWRNPDERHADWGLDTYGQAVLDAMDAVEQATGSDRVALQAFCSGGIITAMLLSHLAAIGQQDRVAAASLAVTVLDWARAGTVAALIDEKAIEEAIEKSRKKGYLDGATLAEVFAWLRPNDLVWSYWVNNYLQGKPPPAFDILFWNADTTRMTAALHRDFIDVALGNRLTQPGATTMLGTPVDLSTITVDTYLTAGIADHLCPWQSCYRSTQLLGGRNRFVLSTSGHIASLVNPPGNKKATFQVAEETPEDPQRWMAAAETVQGSWWPDFVAWLGERCGDEVPAPTDLAGPLEVLGDAPGTYVLDK